MKKIYIVEDDQGIREVLEVFLGLENFEVQSFASVAEFKKRDISLFPDLYLFDVQLPDGMGTDLCQNVKSLNGGRDIPVMMMSAHASIRDIAKFCTPDEIIAKPFDLNNLLEKIKSFLHG